MNYRSLVLLCVLGCAPGLDLEADVSVTTDETVEKERALLTAAQLDELLAPIALYPDPLVAIILPAATFPADVVMAARYLKAGGDLEAVESQSWDDSVKALARYPEVVKWMDENLAWTQQVGAAFLLQPAAVLTGTQRLRAAARAAGNLNDSPEQTVVVERETIRIVPAQPEVIYVPVYDPVCVYRPRVVDVYYSRPLVTFSTGYRAGFWLSYHCNWGYNTVVVISRPHRAVAWQTYPRWSCPPRSVVYDHHDWCPAPTKVQAVRRDYEHRSRVVVSRPTSNSYAQRGPEREGAPRGTGLSSGGDVRPARANNNTSASRPTTPAAASISGTVAPRPAQPAADSNRLNRFGQTPATRPVTGGPASRPGTGRETRVENTPAPSAGTVSVSLVSPARGERGGQANRRSQNVLTTPVPGVVTAPVSSSVTARPGMSSDSASSRRIQPATPGVSGIAAARSAGAVSDFRSRQSAAPASNRILAPVRETTATVTAPRRERETRMAPESSTSVRPVVRPSAGAVQSMPTSRVRSSVSATAPATTAETETSTSRPRG